MHPERTAAGGARPRFSAVKANLHGMERLLRFLRAVLRARPWSSEAMTATRLGDLDHDPSQGVRHVARWDRVGGG
jgi:hypothetical protein